MRRIYYLWAAGLLLKGIGASWDVAWHFKLLREAISPPHMINLVGEVLVLAALLHELRHLAPHRRGPLYVVMAGMGIFLLAIPFDQFWHTVFGIDITTWSPAHLMLFYGTVVAVAGIALLFLADLRHERGGLPRATNGERVMLLFFLIFLAEAMAFPLTYNEYTTIAVRTALEDPSQLDPAIVEMVRTVPDPIFHGTPHWLYPLYSIGFVALLATLIRAALGPGWAAATFVGASIERFVANGIIDAAGWPAAVVPWQYVGMGLLVEVVWLVPAPARARALAGGLAAALAAYVYFVSPPPFVDAVPLDAGSWPVGLPLAALLALAGYELHRRSDVLLDRVPEQVTAWAREKWEAWAPR